MSNENRRGGFFSRRSRDRREQTHKRENLSLPEASPAPAPPRQEAPAKGGTKSLRMSEKARKRLGRLHTNTGKRKSALFRKMLGGGLYFEPEELGGHKCEAKFTVDLTDAEYQALHDAKVQYETGLVNIVSALILQHPL